MQTIPDSPVSVGAPVFRRRQVVAGFAAGVVSLAVPSLRAQTAAKGVTTIVVPQAPGGAVDIGARAISEYLSTARATPAIVVNKPGAAGEIAASFVAAAPPDGATLLMGNSSTMVVAPQVKKTRYDPLGDFRPLGGILVLDTILVANKSLGFRNLADVVRYAKANPGKLAYSSNGVGGAFHLAMEYFQSLTGTKLLHVPFNGASQAEMAVVSNQVGVMVANAGPAMAHIRSGTLVPLAVVGSKRSIALPDLVLASSVIPGFEANTWVAVYGPAGLPERQAVEMNAALDHFFIDRKEFLLTRGFVPVPGTLADAAAWMKKELRTWGAIVAEARKNGPIE